MSEQLKSVCIVGATGNVGSAATRAFLAAKWRVRILRRQNQYVSDHKTTLMREFEAAGAEVVQVKDLFGMDEAQLARALAGMDTVVSCTPFTVSAVEQRHLLRASIAAGVRRFVPSEYGLDYDIVKHVKEENEFMDWAEAKWVFREELRAQTAIEHTIVCAGLMPEYMFGGAIIAGEAMPALVPQTMAGQKVAWSTAAAVGEKLPAILSAPGSRNAVVHAGCTAYCTWDEAVESCSEALGEALPAQYVTLENLRAMHEGTDDHVLKHVFGLLATLEHAATTGLNPPAGCVADLCVNGSLGFWSTSLAAPPRINDDQFLQAGDEGAGWPGPTVVVHV